LAVVVVRALENQQASINNVQTSVNESRKDHSRVEFYMRGVCLHTARDESEREDCRYVDVGR
jgi:hypothetical protein